MQAERFEQIALPHLESVYRAAVALCGRSDLAEDLTQMTFVRALERFHTLKQGKSCKAWLLHIVRNLWIDRLRHKRAAGTKVPMDENLEARPRETRKDEKDRLVGRGGFAGEFLGYARD